jgi:hypothetical protein
MEDARLAVLDCFQTCESFWKAVETQVWTKTGNADDERRDYYQSRSFAKKTLEKMSDADAARIVHDVFPKNRLVNVRFNGDSTDDLANQVSFLLNPNSYVLFKSLPLQ